MDFLLHLARFSAFSCRICCIFNFQVLSDLILGTGTCTLTIFLEVSHSQSGNINIRLKGSPTPNSYSILSRTHFLRPDARRFSRTSRSPRATSTEEESIFYGRNTRSIFSMMCLFFFFFKHGQAPPRCKAAPPAAERTPSVPFKANKAHAEKAIVHEARDAVNLKGKSY